MDDVSSIPLPEVFVDDSGRKFHYAWVDNGSSQVGVHFSAFFGDWGDNPKYRATFGGYFHRLKMLSSDRSMNWLFLCDAFGIERNGTYYTGKKDDLFVERAIREILWKVGVGSRFDPTSVVTIGSSMGATAALKFGIELGTAGIVAISPHIDLDTSARLQGREEHVKWILDGGDTQALENRWLTRQVSLMIEHAIETRRTLPPVFIQSCKDDYGVHVEQVLPTVSKWKQAGMVVLDERSCGGHTSEYATRSVILDATHSFLNQQPISVRSYKWNPTFRPHSLARGAYRQVRRRAGRLKVKLGRATPGFK